MSLPSLFPFYVLVRHALAKVSIDTAACDLAFGFGRTSVALGGGGAICNVQGSAEVSRI